MKALVCCFFMALSVLCLPFRGISQQAKISAVTTADSVLIGDHFGLILTLRCPAGVQVQWPTLADTAGLGLEILSRSGPDTLTDLRTRETVYTDSLTLTCFDSGYFFIQPFCFVIHGPGGADTLCTEPAGIFVNTVAVDTTQAIKDIKPPLRVALTFREILPWILGILGLLSAALLTYFILFKIRKRPRVTPDNPFHSMPPHLAALGELEKLRRERLWENGQVKAYYSRLTEILRTYMEVRWHFQAMEMITSEIIDSLNSCEILPDAVVTTEGIFVLSDRVKFARYFPLPDENDRVMKDAVAFVRLTSAVSPGATEDFQSKTEAT